MNTRSSRVRPIARAGLTAKGIVYCLLGLLALMAAFHIGGTSSSEADKKGVFSFVQHQPGGRVLLALIAVGLFCYCVWRFISAFHSQERQDMKKGWGKRVRYVFSGLVYLSLAFYAAAMVLEKQKEGGGKKAMLSQLFDQPYGQLLAGLLAAVLAITGIYQGYYGVSEKYKKHINTMRLNDQASVNLLVSGKIGYLARGFVWLVISWMLAKAAWSANASQTADTSGAFSYLRGGWYGPYVMGVVATGLICYGLFNFIRARFENFR
jgi:hypothetical protein